MDLINNIGGVLSAVGAGLIVLIAAFLRGKSTGKKQEQHERNEQIFKQREQTQTAIKEVENETSSTNDDGVVEQLKQWVRKSKV